MDTWEVACGSSRIETGAGEVVQGTGVQREMVVVDKKN